MPWGGIESALKLSEKLELEQIAVFHLSFDEVCIQTQFALSPKTLSSLSRQSYFIFYLNAHYCTKKNAMILAIVF